MQTRQTAHHFLEPELPLLSAISGAVVLLDPELHVLYWNGPAEALYGLTAEQVLGRRLDLCYPDLSRALPTARLVADSPSASREWSGELELPSRWGLKRAVHCELAVLRTSHDAVQALLWTAHEISSRQAAGTEQWPAFLPPVLQDASNGGVEPVELPPASHAHNGRTTAHQRQDIVLWAEDDDNDAMLMFRAWEKAQVPERLVRVRDGDEVIAYLEGRGIYADRESYPLPALLLLDMNMPRKSGLDVLEWLQEHPTFRELPVVVLTASLARSDIQRVAQMGVKTYVVKPSDPAEWLVKVKTLTLHGGST